MVWGLPQEILRHISVERAEFQKFRIEKHPRADIKGGIMRKYAQE